MRGFEAADYLCMKHGKFFYLFFFLAGRDCSCSMLGWRLALVVHMCNNMDKAPLAPLALSPKFRHLCSYTGINII